MRILLGPQYCKHCEGEGKNFLFFKCKKCNGTGKKLNYNPGSRPKVTPQFAARKKDA